MNFRLIAGVLILIGGVLLFYRKSRQSEGMVIVLNGPSGSGKTSIAKEFQNLMMPTLWIKTGIDTLFDAPMPNITPENMSYWQSSNPIRWVKQSKDQLGNNVITLHVGPEGEKVAYAMNSAIAAYVQNGCKVIVDYIAYDHAWFDDLRKKLAPYKTYYIAVDIPLQTLEEREAARGTSPKGHARSHYATVYGNYTYDLRVNSQQHSAKEIAQQLQALVINQGTA